MSRKRRWILLSICCLAALAAIVLMRYSWFAAEYGYPPPPSEPDLSNHPVYSRYDFGKDEHVLDVGMQPLWVPTNLITETMRRDLVLHKALSKYGLKIRFHAFLKGADVNFFLGRGDVEVAIGGDMPALTAAADFDAVIAALIQQGFCAVVSRNYLLLKELRGKRIAYAFGSNAHYALLNALAWSGLHEQDVRLIPLDVSEMPKALDEGRIDAFSAWEPTPFLARTRYPDQTIIHKSLSSGYLYFSRPFAQKHPEAVRQILASQIRALRWLKQKDHLLQAARWALAAGEQLAGSPISLSPEDYITLAKNDLLRTTSVPAIPKSDLAADGRLLREFEFLKDLGKIHATTKWLRIRSCFDRSLIAEVLTAERKYQLHTYEYQDDQAAGIEEGTNLDTQK